MMTLWTTCLVVFCVTSGVFVHGAPATSGRRSSRDLDQIDGLRARLIRLQEQIDALGANRAKTGSHPDGGRETGSNVGVDDVSAEDDISRLQEGTEAQMTSEQQQRLTQKLAKTLDGGSDLRDLAETLTKMLKKSKDKDADGVPANSYGEYLGDTENTDGYKSDVASFDATKEEEKRGKPSKDKLDVEVDDKRLRDFYNILMRMYSDQMEEQNSQQQFMPDSSNSGSSHSVPLVHVDEGAFGDFVSGADKRTSQSFSTRPRAHALRDIVMSAVERKLLRDIQEASEAGISVDDIIRDLQRQAGVRDTRS